MGRQPAEGFDGRFARMAFLRRTQDREKSDRAMRQVEHRAQLILHLQQVDGGAAAGIAAHRLHVVQGVVEIERAGADAIDVGRSRVPGVDLAGIVLRREFSRIAVIFRGQRTARAVGHRQDRGADAKQSRQVFERLAPSRIAHSRSI